MREFVYIKEDLTRHNLLEFEYLIEEYWYYLYNKIQNSTATNIALSKELSYIIFI